MALSYIIEYLLSYQRPGGGPLVRGSVSQLLIPIFPANTSITLTSGPLGTDYGYIPFRLGLGPAMVPNAFSGWAQQWGGRVQEGVLTAYLMTRDIDAYGLVTESEPSIAQITNESPLNQYYEGYTFVLAIRSEEDFGLVLDALRHISTSAKAEQLAQEANALLRQLTGGPPAPQPPLGGE